MKIPLVKDFPDVIVLDKNMALLIWKGQLTLF
jgi:hypothetical protein